MGAFVHGPSGREVPQSPPAGPDTSKSQAGLAPVLDCRGT